MQEVARNAVADLQPLAICFFTDLNNNAGQLVSHAVWRIPAKDVFNKVRVRAADRAVCDLDFDVLVPTGHVREVGDFNFSAFCLVSFSQASDFCYRYGFHSNYLLSQSKLISDFTTVYKLTQVIIYNSV